MGCCGRPNNRAQKGGEIGYHSRYAYRSSSQIARVKELGASHCPTCSALTVGDPCSVCGIVKTQEPAQAEE